MIALIHVTPSLLFLLVSVLSQCIISGFAEEFLVGGLGGVRAGESVEVTLIYSQDLSYATDACR